MDSRATQLSPEDKQLLEACSRFIQKVDRDPTMVGQTLKHGATWDEFRALQVGYRQVAKIVYGDEAAWAHEGGGVDQKVGG